MDQEKRRKLRDKIALLLRKTTEAGCTEAEAQSAFALAMRLMAEHNIEMAEIKESGEISHADAEFVEQSTGTMDEWRVEVEMVCAICTDYFFVRAFRTNVGGKFRATFFGTAPNVQTAVFVFQGLMAAMDRLWLALRKTQPWTPRNGRKAFCVGLVKGFADKLKEEREIMRAEASVLHSKSEIVLADLNRKTDIEFAAKYPRMGHSQGPDLGGLDGSTLQKGYKAGRDLNIAPGIGHGGRGGKALPG